MQLQQALPRFEAAGIRVFAVSYDSVDVLGGFAEEHGITYPLLSDEGSEVIRRFGIFNTLIQPHEGDRYGIPFPGSYIVDEDGRVAEKLFYRIYRTRLAAQSVLKDAFGVDLDVTLHPRAEIEGEGVRISAVLGSESLTYTQRVPLYVRLDLDPGLHVYAPPVPDGFTATEVELDLPERIEAAPPIFPEAHPFRVEGIDADFMAMDGRVEIAIPLISQIEDEESVRIGVTVRYQACTDRECYFPREERLELEVPVGRLNRPAPPPS